ncbi:MAG: phosphotransferase family protein [Polyangiaceae bacterium]
MTALTEEAQGRVREVVGGDVTRVTRLAGGACQENYLVACTMPSGETTSWVLRSDARSSLPGSIDRAAEHAVMRAAADAGVRTPRPLDLLPELFGPRTSAYLVPFVEGDAIGRKIVKAPELAKARETLHLVLAKELARIHAVTPATAPHLFGGAASSPGPRVSPAKRRLAAMRSFMDGLARKRPTLAWLVRWLSENEPPDDDGDVLVHGDFRTGNFMVAPEGLMAILDWEFSHFGSPYEDLTWVSVRDWRFGQLGLPIGGFAAREPFYAAYAEASGRTVDLAKVHYWEILGNVSWALGAACQSERYTRHGEEDLELLAIGRRAAEMEYEALRLVEKGSV